KAPSGGHERPVALARELDGAQRAVEALIRTARRDPEAVAALEARHRVGRRQRVGRHPADVERDGPRAGRVSERRVGRAMGALFGVEVADHAHRHEHRGRHYTWCPVMTQRGKVIPFPKKPAPPDERALTEVHRCNQAEAIVVKGLFESEGIPTVLRSRIPHSFHPSTVGAQGEVMILVPAADAAHSRRLLERYASAYRDLRRRGRREPQSSEEITAVRARATRSRATGSSVANASRGV